MRPHDKTEQLPPYFECAVNGSQQVLNVHRATFGASMILLEQQKMRRTGIRQLSNWNIVKFMVMLLPEYFECA
jgi:hypothetical protein